MYPAFGSARWPWPFWGYARSVVSLADRPFQPSGLSDSGGVCFPFHACLVRELLWIMTGRQTLAMTSSLWASNGVRCLNTLQAMRASLLARAMASLFRCMRLDARASQSPKLKSGQRWGRIRTTLAAWTNSMRRYRLPRFEIRPRTVRPPVLYCRGMRPIQAAKSRPRSKTSPRPTAATIAVEIKGPIYVHK